MAAGIIKRKRRLSRKQIDMAEILSLILLIQCPHPHTMESFRRMYSPGHKSSAAIKPISAPPHFLPAFHMYKLSLCMHIQVSPKPPPPSVDHVLVSVRLGREAANLPTNRTLIFDAAVGAAALERVVCGVATVGPREKQSDVASSAAGASTKSANKVTGFEIVPGDGSRNVREADGVVARRVGVQSHGDEARAVGAVVAALRVRVIGRHRVRDVLRDPGLAAGDDLSAFDIATVRGCAAGATTIAFPDDHVIRARLHVVVGNIAPVRCLVPDRVTEDDLAVGLACKLDIDALIVCLDSAVTGSGAAAAVDTVGLDRVCGDGGDSRGQSQGQACKLHDVGFGRRKCFGESGSALGVVGCSN